METSSPLSDMGHPVESTVMPRLRDVIPFGKVMSASSSGMLPLALLALALSTVFLFGNDRGLFYRPGHHDTISSEHLTIAENLSPQHGFLMFRRQILDADGGAIYEPYNRFPIGSYALTKLATLPFGGDLSAKVYAARALMLLAFSATAVLAYLSLCRLTSNRWIALAATSLAFSSHFCLYYNDMISPDVVIGSFGVMLTFHGMVIFVQDARFYQLLGKTCAALLMDWHVFALLLPFVVLCLGSEMLRVRASILPPLTLGRVKRLASIITFSRCSLLGGAALLVGVLSLSFNFTNEYRALDGETSLTELPSFRSMMRRLGVDDHLISTNDNYRWPNFSGIQARHITQMTIPFAALRHLGDYLPPPRTAAIGSALPMSGLGVLIFCASLLLGLTLMRNKILPAALLLYGLCWAILVRGSVGTHNFEAWIYIGVPLIFFSGLLLLIHRMMKRDGIIVGAAIAAVLVFALSSFQMSRVAHSADVAQFKREALGDFDAIRRLTPEGAIISVRSRGNAVMAPNWGFQVGFAGARHALSFYLSQRIIQYRGPLVDHGFTITDERIDTDALLTPRNRQVFLYDSERLSAHYLSERQAVLSREPAVRSRFDVYTNERELLYFKDSCTLADTRDRFFLHVVPVDENVLSDERRPHGFDIRDFDFEARGVIFEGKCWVTVNLPQYDIAKIRTGQFNGSGEIWEGEVKMLEDKE